jgi:hypothetical protein
MTKSRQNELKESEAATQHTKTLAMKEVCYCCLGLEGNGFDYVLPRATTRTSSLAHVARKKMQHTQRYMCHLFSRYVS